MPFATLWLGVGRLLRVARSQTTSCSPLARQSQHIWTRWESQLDSAPNHGGFNGR